MATEKSSASNKYVGAADAEQASAHLKGAVPHERINVQMAQNVLLVWLDNNIDDNSADSRNTITQLRCVVNIIKSFTDSDHCVDFLTDIYNPKICLIISGALCQSIVPLLHDVSQLHTILIFSENKTEHEQWAKDWFKIKGVFTDISPICEILKQAVQQCEQSAVPISFITTSEDVSKKNLDQLDPSFMYTQILKEILLTIKFEQKHIEEFVDHCREQFAENQSKLKNVDQLERNYHDKMPIWWYTYEYFLYSMLNRALRVMDLNIITKMGFFIDDLHRNIEQLHKEQFHVQNFGNTFTVYRGQGMSQTDFEQMKKTKGGLISFNNFLSTTKNRDVSLLFVETVENNPDLVGILFVMTIDPSKSSTPFASINRISHFAVEEEVLFSMHTVFRICDIKPSNGNHCLYEVDLTLTSDSDKDLRVLTDRIREETFPHAPGWYRLGLMLIQIGQSDKGHQVYEILLEQATDDSEKGPIYHQMGCAKVAQGEYNEAITFYQKSLEIEQKTLPPNHSGLANSYNNIGSVYTSMGEYSKALSYFEKALGIRQKTLPPNHPDLAASYNNIGSVYDSIGEYSKAVSYHEKALVIKQITLPPNHPDFAMSYNNIGSMYNSMGEYSKALSYYDKALEIRQKTLPPNHPDLAGSYDNIGSVYNSMGEYSKALSYHEKALEIRQKTLPANLPDLADSYNNIGSVYDSIGEYSKALPYYDKALEIRQKNTFSESS